MGCGKSTVGAAVAQALGWAFVDLDEEIERAADRSIPDLFQGEGETGFRDREHEALRRQTARCLAGERAIIALGGGTYAYSRNRDLLRETGLTVWLDAPGETLWVRVRRSPHRPLARDRAEFLRLHAARRESYAQADVRIDASGGPRAVTGEVLRLRWVQGLTGDA